MFSGRVVKHLFIPAAAVVGGKAKDADCTCRPSELPIYTPRDLHTPPKEESLPDQPGPLEQTFGQIRRGIFSVVAEIKTYSHIAEDLFNQSLSGAQDAVGYLQKEENVTPKYGAIGIGGLAGYVLGMRGGFFKKTFYVSAGVLGVAAICYPQQAAEYSKTSIAEARHYSTIAYNFIHGVKKDDPPLELPSIPIPGSLSEAWDLAKNLGKSTTSLVTEKNEEKADGKPE